jgi:4-hydroxybenzoate polyprenyltransferase
MATALGDDAAAGEGNERSLFVDLDGSLVRTDTLWESLFLAIRRRLVNLFLLPVWVLRGKAYFKCRLAEEARPDPALLPYNTEVLNYLRDQKRRGRVIVLATAAEEGIARSVAAEQLLFDEVLATNRNENLSGRRKLAAIRAKAGGSGFDYIGDSRKDLPVFRAATEAMLVEPSPVLVRIVRRSANLTRVFRDPRRPRWRDLLKAMRPHQWAKNLLLAVPVVMAHRLADPDAMMSLLVGIVAMSLAASSVYLVNDLMDLDADRRHPKKRHRPFAAGTVSMATGAVTAMMLLAASLALSWWILPPRFTALLVLYLLITTLYSARLKNLLLVDVIILAGLYTLRVLAGAVATDCEVSAWLLAFSLFIFTSLAFAKRYEELTNRSGPAGGSLPGRGYQDGDTGIILVLGPTSGYLAVLVLALYINSDKVTTLYRRPELLWLLCPLLIYWISRIWFLAHRQEIHHDPLVFVLSDKTSYLVGAAGAVILVAATLS